MNEYQICLTFDSHIEVINILKEVTLTSQELEHEITQKLVSLKDASFLAPTTTLRYIRVMKVEKNTVTKS